MKRNRHIVFRAWLIFWLMALPLIHIHPESDHAHGMPGHVHGGTYHTVLSSTPICAYENHDHHHDSFSSGEQSPLPDSTQHLPHGMEHSTYEFSVFNSSIDPIFNGSSSFSAFDGVVASEKDRPTLTPIPGTSFSFRETLLSAFITKSFSPRGPPILLV
ncbi:hypothetical protein [Nitrospira sp. M1]